MVRRRKVLAVGGIRSYNKEGYHEYVVIVIDVVVVVVVVVVAFISSPVNTI